ncbi:MAG: hypothetical protein M1823_004860 [Watsoniomyces obsoletus]|nr:MAG: hypothetical protein M1823_004860 [Watsoniomyces obsoletus]
MSSPSQNQSPTKLKINIGSAPSTTPTPESPPPSAGPTKLKIKFGGAGSGSSAPQSPASVAKVKVTAPKSKNARKPSAAAASKKKTPVPASASSSVPTKKRAKPTEVDPIQNGQTDHADQPHVKGSKKRAKPSEDDSIPNGQTHATEQPPVKRPKLTITSTPAAADVSSPVPSKKRAKPTEDDSIDHDHTNGAEQPQIKRLKLTSKTPTTPIIRTKFKGKVPTRELGSGYDSESSDRELDPQIEEDFFLRMTPGEDCDYLHQALRERKVGAPMRDGGADVTMKFFQRTGRRAVVTIRGRHYAAVLVDLPGVVEGMKSWDRRGWWKSADIAHMLIVIGRVATEEAALTVPLPAGVDAQTYMYPHGLTPPLRDARRRRFRKRVHTRTIEAVEEEVERLLAEDAASGLGNSRAWLVEPGRLTRGSSVAAPAEGEEEVVAGGVYRGEEEEESDEDDAGLEADLEQAMLAAEEEEAASLTPAAVIAPVEAVVATLGGPTPPSAATAEESSDEDDDVVAEAAAADEADDDDDALERQRDRRRLREEVADLEAVINNEMAKLASVVRPLLAEKVRVKVRGLEAELALKRRMLGELEGRVEEEEEL